MSDNIDRMATRAEDTAQAAADSAKDAVRAAADCASHAVRTVQERPFFYLGAAFLAGALTGFCLRR